jgi:Asp-tRNA(Asn)/Glu-tRNA(Gln) amidotransferase A subunit family amidase
MPVISVPVLRDESLPLGRQVAGFRDRDAATFAVAAWIMTKIITQRMNADA